MKAILNGKSNATLANYDVNHQGKYRKVITLFRREKLGDIVCSEPIIRAFLKEGKKVEFTTSRIGKELFSLYPNLLVKVSDRCPPYAINLHSIELGEVLDSKFGKIHRLNALWYGSITEIYELIVKSKLKKDGLKLCYQPIIYFQKENVLGLRKKYVVIHRFSNDKSKVSEIRYWDYIIKKLIDRNLLVVEIGGSDVADIKTYKFDNKNFLDLRGKCSLLETTQIISGATLFIGVMSGPSHIANAVKTPGVIISRQYAHYDFHNPYSGFYGEEKKVSIHFYKRQITEIPINIVMKDIHTLLNGGSLTLSFPKRNTLGISKINSFINSTKEFVIWGAGSYGKSILELLKNLSKEVLFFIDSDKEKEGCEIDGVKIYSPTKLIELSRKKIPKIIISTLWWTEVADFLKEKLHLKRWIDYI